MKRNNFKSLAVPKPIDQQPILGMLPIQIVVTGGTGDNNLGGKIQKSSDKHVSDEHILRPENKIGKK